MCRRITCGSCGKPGWAGCGAHVEQILGDVPAADRCQCGSQSGKKIKNQTGEKQSGEKQSGEKLGGFIRRLLSR